MIRADREIKDIERLRGILNECDVCRIAVQDAEGLYIVPLNFGYRLEGETLTLYFHSAKRGRKLDALAKNPEVAFEMDTAHQIVPAEKACAYGYRFRSIIGNGTASFVEDTAEKAQALTNLMQHQTGKIFDFTQKETDTVCVIKVVATGFVGKEHE